MITALNIWTYQYEVIINFIAHILIFVGTFYVALHNRRLPQWHVTPLWYMGLFSLFGAISIIILWTVGPEHPLSYWNVGQMAETMLNIAVASIAVVMLIGTIQTDLKESKKRNKQLSN